jgi:raffinose/stachyose/melibiose transport system permease protein
MNSQLEKKVNDKKAIQGQKERAPKTPKMKKVKLFSNKWVILGMISPGLAVLLFAMAVPIVMSVYYGMTDWSGVGKMNNVGFENFKEILTKDPTFWLSLFNAFCLAAVTILLQNPFAVIIGILLLQAKKGSHFFRTMFFVPAVISVVVTTQLWVHVFNSSYGLLNKVLSGIGLGFLATNWLSNLHTALGSVIFIIIWQGLGWAILFYYAGLVSIPNELKEAARIDGASGLKLYTKVILPLMAPVITATTTIALIACLKQMETVYLSTEGGPGNLTQFLGVYLYFKAFKYNQYGYGNALSVVFVLVCIIGTVLLNRIFKRDVGEF